MVILSWAVIIIFSVRIYKKQAVKPKIWKAIVILWIGIFSFSFNFEMFGSMVKFPILPLGVWILAWIFKDKEERWNVYRSYAWLGFKANFLFLLAAIVLNPIHDVVFPKVKSTTFISNVDYAIIHSLHPSANERVLSKNKLLNELQTMKESEVYSEDWYNELYMSSETNRKNERFPYQLVGTKSKWGSGLDTLIYVEEDGKGLLITTSQKQYYFRSKESFIERGDHVD